ncbi:hypothetical protein [Vibrio phage 2E1]|nr:hypothetical protein [Vibrio phage 2E1]
MLPIENLKVNQDDTYVINSMRQSDLKKKGYNGLVASCPTRLYEIHGQRCREITRMWIILAQHSAKVGK